MFVPSHRNKDIRFPSGWDTWCITSRSTNSAVNGSVRRSVSLIFHSQVSSRLFFGETSIVMLAKSMFRLAFVRVTEEDLPSSFTLIYVVKHVPKGLPITRGPHPKPYQLPALLISGIRRNGVSSSSVMTVGQGLNPSPGLGGMEGGPDCCCVLFIVLHLDSLCRVSTRTTQGKRDDQGRCPS